MKQARNNYKYNTKIRFKITLLISKLFQIIKTTWKIRTTATRITPRKNLNVRLIYYQKFMKFSQNINEIGLNLIGKINLKILTKFEFIHLFSTHRKQTQNFN